MAEAGSVSSPTRPGKLRSFWCFYAANGDSLVTRFAAHLAGNATSHKQLQSSFRPQFHRTEPGRRLKLHAQRSLDDARAAAHYACRSAHGRGDSATDRRGDFAEIAAALVRHRISEVRVVE